MKTKKNIYLKLGQKKILLIPKATGSGKETKLFCKGEELEIIDISLIGATFKDKDNRQIILTDKEIRTDFNF
jgi:hypothetical protein